ncbi:MAG: Gfo/Idh/MocA family oxidoreductase [Anaerolineae bacterium]|nr:Gfo/Idh/MocA family oxidoreductase [Anaerolineae bacterium]
MTDVALVGCAHIHVPGFIKRLQPRPDIRVRAVWDHEPARAEKRAAELGALAVAELDAIWNDPAITAAIICSETDRHLPLVLAGAAAGKHLFVEKPLGLGAADASQMADAIERAGVLFQTGYFQRGNPIHLFLREQVQHGAFGQITRYRQSNCHAGALNGLFDTEWRWMADPAQAGVGGFGDLGTHALDIMLWLLGEVESVTASLGMGTARYPACDETGEGLLKFKNGVIGSLAAAWDDIADPVTLLISGTQGQAAVFKGQLYFQSQRVAGADGKTPWTELPAAWPHAFDLFLDAVTGQPDAPLVSAREAAYRSAVMEALYRGAEQGTWVPVREER